MGPVREDDRGIGPVVGASLLVGIVVLLAVTTGVIVFGLVETGDPAPAARLTLVGGASCGYEVVHEGGDAIDGDRTRLDGVADSDALHGERLTAGESVQVTPEADEVRVVWRQPEDDRSYVLASLSAGGGGGFGCGAGAVYTRGGDDIKVISGQNGSVRYIDAGGSVDVEALGPTRVDVTGDGTVDTPYVSGNDSIRVTNASNESTTLATSASISGTIEGDKTRLWAGRWNGSDPSVFFVNENHDQIYRTNGSGPPVEVAAPGNGAQAVVGRGDIDADGTDELVFADGSQQLRYVEPNGTVRNVDGGQTGSNNGIGAGAIADFDDDGVVSVVAVGGGNEVKVTGEPTADGGEGTTNITGTNAKKSPPTVADVDGDGESEIVYVGKNDEKVKYVDNVTGSPTVEFLTDESGAETDGDDETGTN